MSRATDHTEVHMLQFDTHQQTLHRWKHSFWNDKLRKTVST